MPFFPEDVLYDRNEEVTDRMRKPRKRTRKYESKMKDYFTSWPPEEDSADEERKNDAVLAEKIIEKYSPDLHKKLYNGHSDGHVDHKMLRALLTVCMPGGVLKDFVSKNVKGPRDPVSKDMLKYVFRYDVFSSHKDIYKLIDMLGVKICPYCNRQFITTFTSQDADPKDKKPLPKTRPQLDHFKVKSKYPYLALSINNLIPSCGVCNHMKGERDDETLYPYSEGMGEKFKFKTDIPEQKIVEVLTGARIAPELFNIILDCADKQIDNAYQKRVEASMEVFALKGLYQSHKEYVSDMYFQRYIVTEKMVDSIMEQFGGMFHSRDEVRQALLMMNTSADALGNRPLAKLTKDIKDEIDDYYSGIRPRE